MPKGGKSYGGNHVSTDDKGGKGYRYPGTPKTSGPRNTMGTGELATQPTQGETKNVNNVDTKGR